MHPVGHFRPCIFGLFLYYSSGQRYAFSINNTFYKPSVHQQSSIYMFLYTRHIYRICAAYLDQHCLWLSGTCN